ncbi:hypothetical protein GQ464_010060 [Rhodocaloribacter litoris]|uniref:hypothetical protein n=1 Tax=Rhodocaloribacter litoris TaxID=2558931 RepID=UPI001E5B9325|nr:hypothetical protein [Rhodocaloribacter litoris]QXD13816.1 hypothetical protein GQ464_010060 [Rhodocaloribacter litoris]
MNREEKRRVLRVKRLHDEDWEDDLLQTTAAERLAMVWPLTVDAWTFLEGTLAQSRLQRHIVRLQRREG